MEIIIGHNIFLDRGYYNSSIRILIFTLNKSILYSTENKHEEEKKGKKKPLWSVPGTFSLERHPCTCGGLCAWGRLCFFWVYLLSSATDPRSVIFCLFHDRKSSCPPPSHPWLCIYFYSPLSSLRSWSAPCLGYLRCFLRGMPLIVFVNVHLIKLHGISMVFLKFVFPISHILVHDFTKSEVFKKHR